MMSRAPILHQETRLSSSPASPSQVLYINTTSEPQSAAIGAGRKRGFDEISGLDEESYARKYLATEGSVFFRRKDRAPRSFLWRVLDERKVLEIQSVDLVHDKSNARSESRLTFRIQLPGQIVSNGVAFADPDEADALEAFVFTNQDELYTFTLKPDLLTRETAPGEFDATACFKKYVSNSLPFRHAYRLVAVSSLELLISLHDGSLMHLTRQPNESGAQWRETFFSEGNWGDTIRGLVKFGRHQTVRFGHLELEPSAVAAMAKSPDGKYIWTVSLDHELKAWSTRTGKPIAHMDVLNVRFDDEQRKQQKYVMSAEQGTLMEIVTLPTSSRSSSKRSKVDNDGTYYIVLRSPKDNQFKFYEVSPDFASGDEEKLKFNDLQLSTKLIPPMDELMDTSMWHLEEFHVLPGALWRDSQLWIRARNGKLCRTFRLTFSLWDKKGEATDLEVLWQTGWTVVEPGMQTSEALQTYTDFPGDLENAVDNMAATPTEKWLDFLFYPGRFSTTAIETALNIYRKGRGLPASSGIRSLNAPEAPLKERLTQAITSKIILKRLPNDQPDYNRYKASIQGEWKTFYSLLRDLHIRRNEPIGLALDPRDNLAWSVCADFVAPVRVISQFEALAANEHLLQDDKLQLVDEEIQNKIFPSDEALLQSHVMAAASDFSSRLSGEFRQRFKDYVLLAALGHESGDREYNEKRVQDLYEMHHFSAEVMDDDYQALENSAQSFGGLGDLTDSAIIGVLELMQQEAQVTGVDAHKALNRYGDKFMVAVAQETLERNRHVLFDLLTLVVFMYGDLDREDLHSEFVSEIGPIYDAIIVRLKHNEMLSWLARNEVTEPQEHNRSSKSSQMLDRESSTVTLLERLFIGDWQAISNPEERLPELLTKWSKHWTYGPQLWEEWDGVTGHIMAFLIKGQTYELATEFQKFLSQAEESSSWLRYLEGRLLVATGEYAQASLRFQAAAPGMAEAKRIGGTDTANLLSPDERNYFGIGQSRFYQHVSDIFDKLRIFSYAADFASIALEHLEGGDDFGSSLAEIDRRKALPDSPEVSRIDDTTEEIHILLELNARRNELRIRLFTSLVETGRFNEAFDALVGIGEKPLKSANLSKLVKACIEKDAVESLLELPFEEGDLVSEADAILLGFAKKSLASGSGGIPYHQILYAFRTQRSNFRGAAEILYEYLEHLRYTHSKHGILDAEEETLVQAYVLLINTLACCGEEDAWLLADPIDGVHGVGAKRKLVTIADVRREYGAELDKRSDILQGRFPLVGGGDEMDVL